MMTDSPKMPPHNSRSPRRRSRNHILMWLLVVLIVGRFTLPIILSFIANQLGVPAMTQRILVEKLHQPIQFSGLSLTPTFTAGVLAGLDNVTFKDPKTGVTLKLEKVEAAFPYLELLSGKTVPDSIRLQNGVIRLDQPQATSEKTSRQVSEDAEENPGPETAAKSSAAESSLPEIKLDSVRIEGKQLQALKLDHIQIGQASVSGINMDAAAEASLVKIHLQDVRAINAHKRPIMETLSGYIHWEGNIRRIRKKKLIYQLQNVDITATKADLNAASELTERSNYRFSDVLPEIHVRLQRFEQAMLGSVRIDNSPNQRITITDSGKTYPIPISRLSLQSQASAIVQFKPRKPLLSFTHLNGRLETPTGSLLLTGQGVYAKTDFQPQSVTAPKLPKQSQLDIHVQAWHFPVESIGLLIPKRAETNGFRGIKGNLTGESHFAMNAWEPDNATLSGDIHVSDLQLPPRIVNAETNQQTASLSNGKADIAFSKTGKGPLHFHARNIRIQSGNSVIEANYFPGLIPLKPAFSIHSKNVDLQTWQELSALLLPITRRSLNIPVSGVARIDAAYLPYPRGGSVYTHVDVVQPIAFPTTALKLDSGKLVLEGFQHHLSDARLSAPGLSLVCNLSGTTQAPLQQLLIQGDKLATAPIRKSLPSLRELSIWLPNNWLNEVTKLLAPLDLEATGPFTIGLNELSRSHTPSNTTALTHLAMDLTQLRLHPIENTAAGTDFLFRPFKLFYGLGNLAMVTRGNMVDPQQSSKEKQDETAQFEMVVSSQNEKLDGWGSLSKTSVRDLVRLLATASPLTASLNQLQGTIRGNFQISGTLKAPVIEGRLPFEEIAGCYSPKSLCFAKWRGLLALSENGLFLQESSGLVGNLPTTMQGVFPFKDRQQTQLQIRGQRWDLGHLLKLLESVSPETKAQFDKLAFQIHSGTVSFDLGLSGADLTPNAGTIRVQQVKGRYIPAELIGSIPELVYSIDSGRFMAPNVTLNGQLISLSGFFRSGTQFDIEGHAKKMAVSTLWESLQKAAPVTLPTLANRSGEISLDFKTTPQATQGLLGLHQVTVASPLLPFPVADVNGNITVRNTRNGKLQAETKDLRFSYARSPLHLSGQARPGETLSLKADGVLSPLFIGQLVPGLNEDQPALMGVPFNMTLAQVNDNVQLNLTGTPLPIAPEAANSPLNVTTEAINQAKGRFNAALKLQGDTLNIDDITLQHTSGQSITVNGHMEHIFTPEDTVKDLLLSSTPNFDLSQLHQIIPVDLLANMQGRLTSNLAIHTGSETDTENSDSVKTDEFNGELRFEDVSSKPLKIKKLAGALLFHDKEIDWLVSQFKATGIQVAMSAHTPDLNIRPMPIENAQVSGDEFVISLYTEWFRNFQERLVQHPILKRLFPAKKSHNILSFEVTDGQIALKELILNNLILNNFSSNIRLFATTTLEFTDIKADSADGHVKGSAVFTPKDNNYLSGHFEIDQMQANAVAKVLLGLSNQIFGKLSGTVDFATEGRDLSEQLVYANGVVDFRVQDGRLPAVKKIENLMITANTLAGGIFNLNLNSLFRVLSPVQSDYFAELTGQFQVSNGLLHTDNFKSRGTNFNLDIQGNVRLYDAEANLNIKGTVSKRIRGIFGHIGSLSISRLFSFIPPLQRLISFIPGLGYIPGLGRVKDSRGLGFEVDVIGPIYDPASQKNFRWQK